MDTKLRAEGVRQGSKRKRYDRQFKIAAAKVVLSGEARVVDLAEELGIKGSIPRRCECQGKFPFLGLR